MNKLRILLKLGAEHVLPKYRTLVPLLPEIFSQTAMNKIKLDISQISYKQRLNCCKTTLVYTVCPLEHT